MKLINKTKQQFIELTNKVSDHLPILAKIDIPEYYLLTRLVISKETKYKFIPSHEHLQ